MSLPKPARVLLAIAAAVLSAASGDCQDGARKTANLPPDAEIWGTSVLHGPGPPAERKPLAPPIVPTQWLVVPKEAGADEWTVVSKYIFDPHSAPSSKTASAPPSISPWVTARDSHPSNFLCAYTNLVIERDDVRMAHLEGAKYLFVNGEGFVGDGERYGFRGVPVALRKGANHIFVFGCQGSFTLDFWSPATRLIIGTWDLRWPYNDNFEDDFDIPLFNVSQAPAVDLHVHYGAAVIDCEGCKPHLSDWCDGGYVAPLGLFMASTYFRGFDDGDATSPWEGVVAPVCVYDGGDADADREVLRHPAALPSTTTPNRSLFVRSNVKDTDTLRGRVAVHAVLVHGTHGSAEENAAMLSRARFDQQLTWYRTGVVPFLISDETFHGGRGGEPEPGVAGRIKDADFVVYGNADTNSAWSWLIPGNCPAQAKAGSVSVAGMAVKGQDITGWFVCKRANFPKNNVAAIVGTGTRGVLAGYFLRPLSEPIGKGDFAFYRAASDDRAALQPLTSGSF